MTATILRRMISSKTWWIVGWSVGIVSLITLTLGFYPSFRDQADDFNDVIEKMPEGIKSLIGMGGGVEPLSPIGESGSTPPPIPISDLMPSGIFSITSLKSSAWSRNEG